MKFWDEFKLFLKEYKVLSVAIAFVMGAAVNDLVKSFVNNVFMPLLDPLIPDGTWETATWLIGPVKIGWGPFTASLLHFIILALVVFFLVKKIINRPKKEENKKEEVKV